MVKLSKQAHTNKIRGKQLPPSLAELNKLKPAGVQFLIEDSETTFFDYLRITFADLLLKKVIAVDVISKKAHHRDKRKQTYLMVKAGENFHFYQPSGYEWVFLDILQTKSTILLKRFMEHIFNESPGDAAYKSQLVKQLNLKYYVIMGIPFYLFKRTDLNSKGKAFKQEVSTYLSHVDSNLENWLSSDHEKLKEALKIIGGNIFLLKTLNRITWNAICGIQKASTQNDTIDLSLEQDLQELTPSYYIPELYPILENFFSTAENLIKYERVFTGTRTVNAGL